MHLRKGVFLVFFLCTFFPLRAMGSESHLAPEPCWQTCLRYSSITCITCGGLEFGYGLVSYFTFGGEYVREALSPNQSREKNIALLQQMSAGRQRINSGASKILIGLMGMAFAETARSMARCAALGGQ